MPPATHKEYISSKSATSCDSRLPFSLQVFISPQSVFLAKDASPRDKTNAVVRQVLNAESLAMDSNRMRLNALCPISALPAELLVRIFELYIPMRPTGENSYSFDSSLGWIGVTHVCRLWRDTALQSPCLWSNVCCMTRSTQWRDLMLARTKSAPISIIHDVTWEIPERLHFISEHLHHTRELSLVGPMWDLLPLVSALPHTFDILDTIELRPGSEVSIDGHAVVGDNFELPGAMAGGHLPSLRRLSLRAFWVPWSAPILYGLRHLEVQLHEPCKPAEEAYLSCSHEELFGALKNMPALESLILSDCFPSAPWKYAESDVLKLFRLRVLRLQGPSAVCFGIAKRLQIPAPCQVHLRCNDNTDITEILPFLMTHVGDASDLASWHTLSIKAFDGIFHLDLWRLSDALKEQHLFKPKICADLAVWFHPTEQSLRPLKSICHILPPQTIRIVHALAISVDLTSQDWIDILGQSTEIEGLSVNSNSAISLCQTLSMATDPKLAANAPARLIFEKLAVLELWEVDFRGDWGADGDFFDLDELLVRWRSERQQAGSVPELQISVMACDIEEEWVCDLRNMAKVDVFWDGQEGDCGPEYGESEDDADEDCW